MWRKEETKSPGVAEPAMPPSAAMSQPSTPSNVPAPAVGSALPVSPRAAACITQGIRIKGEITGKEDLFVDGALEGKLDLGNASCTVGPNGKVKADISAREVVVRGHVDGKVEGNMRATGIRPKFSDRFAQFGISEVWNGAADRMAIR